MKGAVAHVLEVCTHLADGTLIDAALRDELDARNRAWGADGISSRRSIQIKQERILRALRKGGAVFGFLGDGVNDTPAMHAADVSLSVESAGDVAKATADLVLTQQEPRRDRGDHRCVRP